MRWFLMHSLTDDNLWFRPLTSETSARNDSPKSAVSDLCIRFLLQLLSRHIARWYAISNRISLRNTKVEMQNMVQFTFRAFYCNLLLKVFATTSISCGKSNCKIKNSDRLAYLPLSHWAESRLRCYSLDLTWTGKWPRQVNVHVKEERTLAEFTHILCIYQNGVHFIHGLVLAY